MREAGGRLFTFGKIASRVLMLVAQRLRGKLVEEEAVIPGEAAELPNSELRGNFDDRCLRRVSRFERCADLVKCSAIEILHRRCAEVLLKRIAKSALGNASRNSELLDGKMLAVMLINKVHRHANDLSSRNRVPAKGMFDFRSRCEHVANLPGQLLLRCLLRRG